MIRKGVLKSYDSSNHQATVQILGSLTTWLAEVPTSHALMATDMVAGRYVAVLTPDPTKPGDSVVIALWTDSTAPAAISTSKIEDADGDTKVDVEESADEDIVRMDVAGVEAFHLSAIGCITLAKNSGCFVYRATSDQSIPDNTATVVQYNAETYDNQNEFDSSSTYRFTATEAGKYLIAAGAYIATFAASTRMLTMIWVNGGHVAQSRLHASHTADMATPILTCKDLAASDYVEVKVKQITGSAQNLRAVDVRNFLAVWKVG
jgi:hypothetical protein